MTDGKLMVRRSNSPCDAAAPFSIWLYQPLARPRKFELILSGIETRELAQRYCRDAESAARRHKEDGYVE